MAALKIRSRTRPVPKIGPVQLEAGSRGRERRAKSRTKRLNISGRGAVSQEIRLTRDALVRSCVLRLRALRANATALGEAGDVRGDADTGGPGTSFVVDFGVLRTVSGVAAPPGSAIVSVRPWTGLEFGKAAAIERVGKQTLRFAELQTQRLQVQLAEALDAAEMASNGAVFLPGPPADLVLSLGEGPPLASYPGRVEPGSGSELSLEEWSASGERLVDITEAVAERVGDPKGEGEVRLEVTLSAASPGDLGLEVETLVASRMRRVGLAGEPEVVFDLAAEAHRFVDLDFDPSGLIEGLRLRLSGELEPPRVLDPVGPTASPDAELIADPHRSYALRLPETDGLGSIEGVRLPLRADGAEAEARITLWSGAESGPQMPIEGGASIPIVVAERENPDAWMTFSLPAALDLEVEASWAALDVVRGRIVMSLAAGAVEGRAAIDVRRGSPIGAWRRLPAIFEPGGGLAHLEPRARVFGSEAKVHPRLPLRLGVAGAGGGLDIDPAGQTVEASFDLDAPLPVGDGRPPRLELAAYSAGSVRIENVDVVWSEPPLEGADNGQRAAPKGKRT